MIQNYIYSITLWDVMQKKRDKATTKKELSGEATSCQIWPIYSPKGSQPFVKITIQYSRLVITWK